jgi:hypothetical protein
VLSRQFKEYSATEEESREQRRKIDEEHQLRKQQRLEQQKRLEEEERERKRLLEDTAEVRAKRLEELRSKWVTISASSGRGGGDDDFNGDDGEDAGKKKRKRTANTLEPSENKVKRNRVKKAKKADKGEGSDSDDVGKRKNRASQLLDSDDEDAASDNDWLEDLDKPISQSTSFLNSASTAAKNSALDSDDDIFGDKEEAQEENKAASATPADSLSEVMAKPAIPTDDGDDFLFD